MSKRKIYAFVVEELAVGAELTAAIFVCLFLIPLRRKELLPLIVSPLFRESAAL